MKSALDRDSCILVVVDVQEKFRPVVFEFDRVVNNCGKLLDGFRIMDLPVIVTEQYPKGLGSTVAEIREKMGKTPVVEKTAFSCLGEEGFKDILEKTGRRQVVLAGIESHVCVINTVLDLHDEDYQVHLAVDAISSRSRRDYKLGVKRAIQEGARIASTEMILFQLLKNANAREFRKVQDIVK